MLRRRLLDAVDGAVSVVDRRCLGKVLGLLLAHRLLLVSKTEHLRVIFRRVLMLGGRVTCLRKPAVRNVLLGLTPFVLHSEI